MANAPIPWRVLNDALATCTEDDLTALIADEIATRASARTINRMHQRLSALRTQRERLELIAQARTK